eukprot:GFUD01016582.1.p1 GENE.GFUD01016582.1~~GFUD01016582.1.p1  ORF type:complete len:154 (-),score=40.36 GFUD01016582.1:120-581(-)
MMTTMKISISTLLLLMLMMTAEAEQNFPYRRCYTCRSRSVLGDCKDTFRPPPPFNASDPAASLDRHVKENPCSSGWCYKQIDGELGDTANSALERGCMVRKPSDGQERCAYVKKNYQRVFMCFCQGDQCNSAGVGGGRVLLTIMLTVLVRLLG